MKTDTLKKTKLLEAIADDQESGYMSKDDPIYLAIKWAVDTGHNLEAVFINLVGLVARPTQRGLSHR